MPFKDLSFLLLTVLISINGRTQEKFKIDTIKFYVGIVISGGSGGYFLNNERIPKARYEQYKKILDQIDYCTPCWMKDYNLEEELVSEGLYYTDCAVGEIIEYFPSEIIKAKGEFKSNPTDDWKGWYQKGGCKKEGTWKYYDEKGNLLKTETFKDGQLVN